MSGVSPRGYGAVGSGSCTLPGAKEFLVCTAGRWWDLVGPQRVRLMLLGEVGSACNWH